MSDGRTVIKVRFADVDWARIVYYPRFYHYFHIAFEELFERELGQRYSDVMQDDDIGYPAVHTECDYLSPVRFGDVLEIAVSCERIGEKSVVLVYRGTLRHDGAECVRGRVTTACVGMSEFRARAIPAHHREMFERLLEA